MMPPDSKAAAPPEWCAALDTRIAARWDALWQMLPRALDPSDAEGVHALRVASRRLRAALTVGRACHHGKGYAKQERIAKTITRALGAVRDGEVQRRLLRERQARAGGLERAALIHVAKRRQAEDRAARRALEQSLRRLRRSSKTSKPPCRCPQDDAPVARGADALIVPARHMLAERAAEVAAYARVIAQPDASDTLHALRIAVKRLRYTLELFADEVGPAAEAALARLKALQDRLGDLHDDDVLIARLRTELRNVARLGRHARPKGAAKRDRRVWGLALALAHARDARQAHYDGALAAWITLVDAGVLAEFQAGAPRRPDGGAGSRASIIGPACSGAWWSPDRAGRRRTASVETVGN